MRASRLLGITAAIGLAASLAACATGSDADGGSAAPGDDSAFPVTIEHAFGETTIEAKPERVGSVAWANHEVAIALGVVPVIMEKATWGDDDADGVMPWVTEKLDELGAETPALYDPADGIDFEAVADAAPDVIIASYSGLTQEDYDTLTKIAPTVAYPGAAWGTTVEDMIRMNSEAIGLAAEGEALIEELDTEAAAAFDAHPALADVNPIFAFTDPSDLSKIGFYTSHDPRAGYLTQLGFGEPAVVTEESEASEEFYVEVSAEDVERLSDVGLFITYGDPDGELLAQLQADPLMSKIPAIADGAIAILPDGTPLAAAANPTPLSIGWGISDYFDTLSAVVQAG